MNGDDGLQPLLRSKTFEDPEMDITPMIDLTFLLLIFFLVSSRMQTTAMVELPPARHGRAVDEKTSVIITLAPDNQGKAIVYCGDGADESRRVKAADAQAQEDAVAEYVEKELAGGLKENVLIKAAKGVLHGEAARLSRAATRPEAVQQLYFGIMEVH